MITKGQFIATGITTDLINVGARLGFPGRKWRASDPGWGQVWYKITQVVDGASHVPRVWLKAERTGRD